jgi:hypothetical protein
MRLRWGRDRDWIGRARPALVLALALATAVVALAALTSGAAASRIETSPSHVDEYTGSDWLGKVTLFWGEIDSPNGKAQFSISGLRFANLCSRRGNELKASIPVGRSKLFHFHGRGFSVQGNVIGSLSSPREIAGTASFATKGCQGGTWWFSAKPAPPS